MLNSGAFFAAVRSPLFGGGLKQSQVDGMNAILAAAPADIELEPLAYCLATTIHETARTMQPVKEYGGDAYYRRMYDIQGSRPAVAKALGNLQPGDGVRFCGRGYVQLTGRSNYLRAGKAVGVDLIAKPDLAMDPAIAARIMFEGMKAGWITGKKLSDYFGPGRSDPVNARRIINGTDKASAIAGHHRQFAAALKAGGYSPGAAPVVVAPKPATPAIEPVVIPSAQPSGWLASLGAWFDRVWAGSVPDLAARG